MKITDVVKSIFLEEEQKETDRNNLRIFYDIDIHIVNPNKNKENKQVTPEPTQQAQTPAPAPQELPPQQIPQQAAPTLNQGVVPPQTESIDTVKYSIFSEDEFTIDKEKDENADYIYKKNGILVVHPNEYENIQTMEDLLDFLADSKDDDGEQILNDAATELILSMIGVQQVPLSDIIDKNDKVIIDVIYGNKKDDSVGFKVLKHEGVNTISIVMKKDNEILDTKFDLKEFNSQLLEFRNKKVHK